MKKFFKLLFLLALPLSLASCNENPQVIPSVSSIALDLEVINLDPQDTFNLEPKAYDKDGNLIENQEFKYNSSNKTVVSINANGQITALKAGSSTITCIAGKQIASCLVKVSGSDIPVVTGLSFSPDSVKIKYGLSYTPNIIVSPSDVEKPVLAWNTSDESVATVADGVVHAVGLGDATIYAAYGSISAKLNVSVVEHGGDVFTIQFEKQNVTILEKGETDLKVITSEDATITWESENSGIASVDDHGHVIANSKGVTVISATANGQRASCTVTVSDGKDPGGDTNLEVFFYIDYNNVNEEEPYLKLDWYVGVPFGSANKPADPANAPDPAFPKFAGWSSHPIIDNIPEDLWNFDSDFVPDGTYVFVLYGIWLDA